jgi:hypothetical protein
VTLNITSSNKNFVFKGADAGKDYIIKMPSTPLALDGEARMDINGGRNITLIGGEIKASSAARTQPVIKFYGQTGTVHVEGLKISGAPKLGEGVQFVNMPSATVQFQNVYFDTLNANCGPRAYHHCDIFQIYNGGPKEVRIDRLSGTTQYQAFMLQHAPSTKWDLRNIDINHVSSDATGKMEGYTMYDIGPDTSTMTFQNVHFYGGAPSAAIWSLKGKTKGVCLMARQLFFR